MVGPCRRRRHTYGHLFPSESRPRLFLLLYVSSITFRMFQMTPLRSYKDTCRFLKRNGLKCIIRAHEAQIEGYRIYRATPEGFASIITVFSAPNYCDAYGNKGAVLHYDGQKVGIRWYYHSQHPFILANMMDAFSWSLPFVAEKSMPCFSNLL
jgi:serine/threonine-protein phosphatase 2B catalytic subunit